jgi:rare lipoprotein A
MRVAALPILNHGRRLRGKGGITREASHSAMNRTAPRAFYGLFVVPLYVTLWRAVLNVHRTRGAGGHMFMDTFTRPVAARAALCAALLGWMTIAAHATSPVAMPVEPVPFAERFVGEHSMSFADRFAGERPAQTQVIYVPANPIFEAVFAPPAALYQPAGDTIVGAASTYDPTDVTDRDSGDMQTASGETYDPQGWSAAIRTDLRDQFGGVGYGKNYRPTFALVEAAGKRAVVRINDVGPLRPGRVIDLNTRAMRYFDPAMQAGVLDTVKVTPLADTDVALGPVDGWPALAVVAAAAWE